MLLGKSWKYKKLLHFLLYHSLNYNFFILIALNLIHQIKTINNFFKLLIQIDIYVYSSLHLMVIFFILIKPSILSLIIIISFQGVNILVIHISVFRLIRIFFVQLINIQESSLFGRLTHWLCYINFRLIKLVFDAIHGIKTLFFCM